MKHKQGGSMHDMTVFSNTPTMTSLELVEFINLQRDESEPILAHSDFLKKVVLVLGFAVAGNFSSYYKASNGKQNPMYRFPKREACLMAMSYSYELQAKVFDRMTSLEKKAADPMAVLSDPAAMRVLLLTYTEKVIALEFKVQEQAPKVEALDRIATKSEGSMCITDSAKHLQVTPKHLFRWLHANAWIYRRAGGSAWVAYQSKMPHFLEHKITTVERSDGTNKVCEQVLVTANGLARLAMLLGVKEAA